VYVVPTFKYQDKEYEGYKISYSRISSYLSCPQRHYFSYVLRLRPKGVERPLWFGGDFHKLLEHRGDSDGLKEARQNIKQAYSELTGRQQEGLGEDYIQDLDTIFGDYLEVWGNEELPIETEHEFLVQIGKYKGLPVYFHGIIDEIYADNSMGEHKTFNFMPDMSVLAMNMQVCLYSKAWELETGQKLDRVRWDYIKSSPAKQPIWLEKSGRFSEATNAGITPMSWRRACEERGIDSDEELSKADKYSQNISNFFFRCSMAIVPEMVDTVWRSFKQIAKDIVTKGDENQVKNISRDCQWCSYRPICYAEFTGADAEYVKNRDYVQREK
jgi:CRISPR/Cas system-associated exonuclease Cas4 (RecB family)